MGLNNIESKLFILQVIGEGIEREEVDPLVKEVIMLTQAIYDRCEELYKAKDLLSLP